MIPTGAVVPGAMMLEGVTIGELLGPISMIALLAMLVGLALIIGRIALDSGSSAGLDAVRSPRAPVFPPADEQPRHAA